ncbi:cGMP-specific 3',5'-cyclic phosphodiesterase isoform X2 [Manduca sexta]|uniref:cGMP-specific 3',5'-cyclic phosphodiesterase isoform X2 n=1 Tax=Manduca sexta TaxID=7130 RepID=UPI001890107B|nr:cGMP-specific 3',5'-cyclic phosphodiesterase isoform X2 [Manduca sexta]
MPSCARTLDMTSEWLRDDCERTMEIRNETERSLNETRTKKCGTPKNVETDPPKKNTETAMTSEEPIDVVKKPDEKKTDDCTNFAGEIPEHKQTDRRMEEQRSLRSHELMRLVYELPEEIKRPEFLENNNMLKENPPITIVEITEQNGCDTELTQQDDAYYNSSPELGNKVVYDVLATNELIMQCAEEFKEVIERTSPDCSDEDLLELKKLLEGKPKVLERYLRECATAEEVNRIHSVTSGGPLSPRPRHEARSTSVTSDLFQLWLSSSPVKRSRSPSSSAQRQLDEADLFMDLIKDVANELDIDVLCHKILVNVCLLTSADRGSLFLAKGTAPNRYLQAKLFDVTRDTELNDALRTARTQEIKIPFGVGVAGLAAQTKHPINIKNAYADPRFNSEIDARTGYKTELILCMPICNYEGDVVGVAQIINKTDGSKEFSPRDVEVFRRYLTFCGIGIQNAQLFESSVLEYKRNQILLALARSIFEEQSNLECLVTKIMTEARELLKCERCAVFILDTDHCESSHLERIVQRPGGRRSATPALPPPAPTRFHTLFELGAQQSRTTLTPRHDNKSTLASIALAVAQSNRSLNISDVKDWLRENGMAHMGVVGDDAINVRTMLCMPIVNANKDVIGVAQLINKDNGSHFTDGDVSIFEAFAIFCGLGIHNTQMYENACKLMAKQKVALECLSYHATASAEDTSKLCQEVIPSAETYNLYSFQFHDFDLSDEDTCRATLRMFLQCSLVEKFHIPYDVLCRWILSVKKNYRPVKYHNWRHALNVAQTMFAMLKTGKMERFMSDLEILGLLVACLCHDLDHRGTNNAFQTKTESPLAILYSTSTMEHHHFDQCVMILNSESNNIFQALSPSDYKDVMRVVETAILSTDLAMYFKKKSKFLELVDNGEFDWQSQEKKELLCGMMMTACDVSAIAKPWEVQHKVAKLVADEFFDQGDLEKLQLNQQPIAMMDREKKDELPQMQVGFIDMICLPLYKVLSDTFPWIQPLYSGTMENRQRWQDLAEKVEMGLTWIDHDTIDKPIEEFTALNEPIKDVELTVTTLKSTKPIPESSSSMALVKPIKTSFHSLRRGKSGNYTSRPARNKLTSLLQISVRRAKHAGEREREREREGERTTDPNSQPHGGRAAAADNQDET